VDQNRLKRKIMTTISVFSTACEMLKALDAGEVSSVELLEMHIYHIEQHNGPVNAIVIHNYEEARRCAEEADRARRSGDRRPLLGLPMTVKDWIELRGVRSTAGDAGFAQMGYTAQDDALVVARLKAAGAIPFAKTNMAPWGGSWFTDNPVFGRSNNPWNLEHTPGGSTGGGAAAVACGFSPLEIGNDIGGSVRVPPAFCGVYGHKPSESAWPRTGQTPDGSGMHLPNQATGLAMMGPLARSAEDLALAFELAAGPDKGEDVAWRLELPRARRQHLSDFRVAVLPPIAWLPVAQSILEKQAELVKLLRQAGATVAEVQPDGFGDLKDFHDIYHRMLVCMMAGGMTREQRLEISAWAREEAIKRDNWLLESGAKAFEAMAMDYVGWWGEREKYREAYRQFFRQWDVLLSPVAFTNAFRHDALPEGELDIDEHTLDVDGQPVLHSHLAVYASLATFCGQPATAFPVGLAHNGLPVGLQVIGPYLEDHTPLEFAALVAQEMGGYQQPPLTS
jgi:amidase